jgi:5-methylcytosine-specific restriction endonuclease McrA
VSGPRKPCARCGGEKGPGERRRYCDECKPFVVEEKREKSNARGRRWHRANREHHNRQMRERRKDPEVAERIDRQSKLWADRKRAGAAFVEDVIPLVVLERDDGVCGICGEDVDPTKFDLDHIIPLRRGGLHNYENVQVAHRACNASKGNRLPEEVAA